MRKYLVEVSFPDGTVTTLDGIFPSCGAAILAGLDVPGSPMRGVVARKGGA